MREESTSSSTPAISGTNTAGLPHPSRGCSISANTDPPRPSAHSSAPGKSTRRPPRSRAALGGITDRISHTQAAASGTLIRKISATTRSPAARRRPAARARPAIAPHAVQLPIAPPRSDSGKVFTITASELGTSSAPATPCSARATTSTPIDGETAHSQRRDAEARHPDREHPPLAVQVAQRATDQDQRAERQQIAVDHPLLRGQPAAQRDLDRRQRDVHDRAVQQHDARAHDAGDQRQALDRRIAAGRHRPTVAAHATPATPRAATGRAGRNICCNVRPKIRPNRAHTAEKEDIVQMGKRSHAGNRRGSSRRYGDDDER